MDNNLTVEKHLQGLISKYGLSISKSIEDIEGSPDFEYNAISIIKAFNQSLSKEYESILNPVNSAIAKASSEILQTLNSQHKKEQLLLEWSRLYVEVCLAICDILHTSVMGKKINNNNKYLALFCIRGAAIRRFNEVLCLCENGYPEGAYAHARLLFEYFVVSEFLSSDTDEISKAYLDSAEINAENEADHYKWASHSLRFAQEKAKGKTITISKLFSKVNESLKSRIQGWDLSNTNFRKSYDDRSVHGHVSAKGVRGRFSREPGYNEIFYIGRQFVGIEAAICCGIIELSKIMIIYVNYIEHETMTVKKEDLLVMCHALHCIYEKIFLIRHDTVTLQPRNFCE